MKYINVNSVLELLAKSEMNVFTVIDFAKIINKSTAYASLILSKNKKAHRLSKGIYYIDNADVYEKASNILFPCYISLSAALQYYELIDQNIVRYTVITTKRHRGINIKEGYVEFITLSKERVFGYALKKGSYIAELEKVFVDCLYFNSPNFDQILSSFSNAINDKNIDIKKFKEYGIKMKSKVLINKIGFLLELNNINAEDLHNFIYKSNYIELEKGAKN